MASNCSCEHNLINTSKTKKNLNCPWGSRSLDTFIYFFPHVKHITGADLWRAPSPELRNGKPQFQKHLCVFARCDDLTRPDWFWFGWSSLKWQPCPALLFYSLGHSRFFSTEVDANSLGHASYLQFWFLLDAARQRSPARSFMDGNYARVAVIALAEK